MGALKNNIAFFGHETEALEHRKFLILRAFYGGHLGWAMEGRFWGLNCLIGEAEGCRLDLTKKGEKARIARALELSLKELEDFLVVLRDEAELIHEEEGIVWTDRTQENLALASEERAAARERRGRPKNAPSPEHPGCSGEHPRCSPEQLDKAKQSEAKEIEEPPRARSVQDPEDEALLAHCRTLAAERKARNPEGYARSLMTRPDVVAGFRSGRSPPGSGYEAVPAPRIACACGGELRSAMETACCVACGTFYGWDRGSRSWTRSEPAAPARAGPEASAGAAADERTWAEAREKLSIVRMAE